MDFKELIQNRRSIRDFTDQSLSRELILDILKECPLAPSSYNGQPWRFIIVQDKNLIKRISDECKKNALAKIRQDPESVLKFDEPDLLDEDYNIFYNAPAVVFIVGADDVPSLDVDCALLAAYFMLSATDKGLGTCWVGLGANVADPQILNEMGLPANYRIVAPIIIGWPRSIPQAKDREALQILKVV